MGLFDSFIPGLGAATGLISGISGLMGAGGAQQDALNRVYASNDNVNKFAIQKWLQDRQYAQDQIASNAGTGGDAVRNMGSNVGAAHAGAGMLGNGTMVSNYTPTGSAIDNYALGVNSQNLGYARNLMKDSNDAYGNVMTDANRTNAQTGMNMYNYAHQDYNNAGNGLASAIGSVAQSYAQNPGRSINTAPVNGNGGNQLAPNLESTVAPAGGMIGAAYNRSIPAVQKQFTRAY